MPFELVNNFTSHIFKALYASQNDIGNLAFSGISLYVLLASITVGLGGRSYDQVAHLLKEDFDELHSLGNWLYSDTAKKWGDMTAIARLSSGFESVIFYPCNLLDHFQRISQLIFDQNLRKIDISNPRMWASEINHWIRWRWVGSDSKIFDKSMLTNNKLIFIYVVSLIAYWKNPFDPVNTEHDIFYDEQGHARNVEMMNQNTYNYIYEKSDDNFRMLFKELERPDLYSVIVLPKEMYTIKDVLKILKVFCFIFTDL
ncbi:Antithrombin-III [Thelohanellus kitauei]|uniref:Antithrombin-III n=1 Tax=Thelohanellus kitauei TaxID=669202 RepID=A0A0C2I7S1_THEKT|nr:Antithrombin-III [Thelohanellus kitauei]